MLANWSTDAPLSERISKPWESLFNKNSYPFGTDAKVEPHRIGRSVGILVGGILICGFFVGVLVGFFVLGVLVGVFVGVLVGRFVEILVGVFVGRFVSFLVGRFVRRVDRHLNF